MKAPPAELAAVVGVLRSTRFLWSNEDELQAGLYAALVDAGLVAEREVRLDEVSRIDLRVGRVGIEVKVKGAWRDVLRQLERYTACEDLDAVVLVTARPLHRRAQPMGTDKPVIIHLVGSTL